MKILDSNDSIYKEILPVINKIYFDYSFLGMRHGEFDSFVKKCIADYEYDFETESVSIEVYYQKIIYDLKKELILKKIELEKLI